MWNGERDLDREYVDQWGLFGLNQYTGDSFDITDPSSAFYDPSVVGTSQYPTIQDLGNTPQDYIDAGLPVPAGLSAPVPSSYGAVTGTAAPAAPNSFASIISAFGGLLKSFAPGTPAAAPGAQPGGSLQVQSSPQGTTVTASTGTPAPTGIMAWIQANPLVAIGGAVLAAVALSSNGKKA